MFQLIVTCYEKRVIINSYHDKVQYTIYKNSCSLYTCISKHRIDYMYSINIIIHVTTQNFRFFIIAIAMPLVTHATSYENRDNLGFFVCMYSI